MPDNRPVDIILSSLFTHHLADDELIRFLRWMAKQARIGWFVNDLHRHALPYHFIRSVMRLVPANRMVRQDRKSVVHGKSVSIRVDRGGRRNIKKKQKKK